MPDKESNEITFICNECEGEVTFEADPSDPDLTCPKCGSKNIEPLEEDE